MQNQLWEIPGEKVPALSYMSRKHNFNFQTASSSLFLELAFIKVSVGLLTYLKLNHLSFYFVHRETLRTKAVQSPINTCSACSLNLP